jgi:DNA repair protein SbcC/Rad50
MFSKIFKKDETAATPLAPPARETAPAPDKSLWEAKLNEAGSDEEKLLTLAKEAPLEEIKLAAIQVLVSEEALKAAEKEFRNHDRRVHREAKQRYELAVATREGREQAAQLIATASTLQAEAHLPANKLVELDHAWQAIDHKLLDAAQVEQFTAAWTALSTQSRERGDKLQQAKRWAAEANGAASHLVAVISGIAGGSVEPAALDAALDTARSDVETRLAAAPVMEDGKGAQISAAATRLSDALALADQVMPRLAILDEIAKAGETQPADIAARWQALPVVTDRNTSSALEQRFKQWQLGKNEADQAAAAAKKQEQSEQSKAERQARLEKITALVTRAETALAEGHVGEATKQLGALDDMLQPHSVDKKLQQRIETVQSEVARLKGWQHWSGGRVRDDLALEAEALAKASSTEKLAVKAHGDAIENLRERWKELDKLGGATNRTLWLRFDSALKTAYLPVAAHLAKLKEARTQNLAARNALITTLDAVDIGSTEKQPDFRALARHLENFQSEWRKLGPVEHTVPRKAQPGLDQKLKAAVARVESPLQDARRVEQLKREKLIERAKALAADTKSRDTINKVRELQGEWQQHAKGLPLARKVENVLWGQFKAATDTVFAQRDAANAARETEWSNARTARDALIARLTALNADTPAGEIRKTLADVDSEWRKAGEPSRNDAPKLEQRFRNARDAAQQHLAGSALRVWQQTCDAIAAKVALCAEAESGAAGTDIAERWAALATLPAEWEKPLAARLASAPNAQSAKKDASSLPQLILQIESALDIPSPAEFESARRELKLRAMKNAIEGRQSATVTAKDIEGLIATALGHVVPDSQSAGRIATILRALRNKPLSMASGRSR